MGVGSAAPGRGSGGGSSTGTFVFADIAGFTALTEAHGDETAADLADAFAADVRARLAPDDGELIKTIGDAVMVRCTSPSVAVHLGLWIVNEPARAHGAPMVRIGMHHGAAVRRGDDYFGASVNLAARVAGLAIGGQVLVTEAVRDGVPTTSAMTTFTERGRHHFRNILEPVRLFEVSGPAREEPDRPIDPVCRMAVDPGRATGTLNHAGTRYSFCSLECAGRFATSPDAYLRRS